MARRRRTDFFSIIVFGLAIFGGYVIYTRYQDPIENAYQSGKRIAKTVKKEVNR